MKIRFKKTSGFTLVEMTLYIALTSILMVSLMQSMLTLLEHDETATSREVVQQQLRVVMEQIVQDIRGADSVNDSVSDFLNSNGALGLNYTDTDVNPTVYKLNNYKVQVRRGIGVWRDISSNDVRVTKLHFQKMTSGSSPTIAVTIEGVDPFVENTLVSDSVTVRNVANIRDRFAAPDPRVIYGEYFYSNASNNPIFSISSFSGSSVTSSSSSSSSSSSLSSSSSTVSSSSSDPCTSSSVASSSSVVASSSSASSCSSITFVGVTGLYKTGEVQGAASSDGLGNNCYADANWYGSGAFIIATKYVSWAGADNEWIGPSCLYDFIDEQYIPLDYFLDITVDPSVVSTLTLTGSYAADNYLTDMKVNGVTIPSSNYGTWGTQQFQTYRQFTIPPGNWVSGTNTIQFSIINGHFTSGDNWSPAGLSIVWGNCVGGASSSSASACLATGESCANPTDTCCGYCDPLGPDLCDVCSMPTTGAWCSKDSHCCDGETCVSNTCTAGASSSSVAQVPWNQSVLIADLLLAQASSTSMSVSTAISSSVSSVSSDPCASSVAASSVSSTISSCPANYTCSTDTDCSTFSGGVGPVCGASEVCCGTTTDTCTQYVEGCFGNASGCVDGVCDAGGTPQACACGAPALCCVFEDDLSITFTATTCTILNGKTLPLTKVANLDPLQPSPDGWSGSLVYVDGADTHVIEVNAFNNCAENWSVDIRCYSNGYLTLDDAFYGDTYQCLAGSNSALGSVWIDQACGCGEEADPYAAFSITTP